MVTLKKITAFGNFTTSEKAVLQQFIVFMVAFVVKIAIIMTLMVGRDWPYFVYDCMYVVSHYFVDFAPIFFMLLCHSRQ